MFSATSSRVLAAPSTHFVDREHSEISNVAKMEAADRTVSIDLLIRGLVILGARPRDIAQALGRETGAAA